MSRDIALQILGYLASVLVTVSLMMRSIVRLRWINLAGAIFFTVYGVLIRAYPVAALNLAVVGINIYHLWKMRTRVHEAFAVVEMAPDASYVQQFLRFYGRDIDRTQPSAVMKVPGSDHVLVVVRDMVPAGIVALSAPDGAGTGTVVLDYVTPAYRDLKVGTFLYRTETQHLRQLGYRTLETAAGTDDHRRFLERMGFRPQDERYRLELGAPAATQVR